jgi:hypothetical protein
MMNHVQLCESSPLNDAHFEMGRTIRGCGRVCASSAVGLLQLQLVVRKLRRSGCQPVSEHTAPRSLCTHIGPL